MMSKVFVKTNAKSKLVARVTFGLPGSMWADTIYLLGDFNEWRPGPDPLEHARDGGWSLTKEFEVGRAFQFRYLVNGQDWLNDNQADAYVPNPYGSQNCLVVTDPQYRRFRD